MSLPEISARTVSSDSEIQVTITYSDKQTAVLKPGQMGIQELLRKVSRSDQRARTRWSEGASMASLAFTPGPAWGSHKLRTCNLQYGYDEVCFPLHEKGIAWFERDWTRSSGGS